MLCHSLLHVGLAIGALAGHAHAAPAHMTDDLSDTPLPIVVWHGLGDQFNSDGLKDIQAMAEAINPGTFVHIIAIDEDPNQDRSATFTGNVTDQVSKVCEELAKHPILSTAPAIDAIGISQGGQFLRGYVERCNWPQIRSLVTFGSQHNGIVKFRVCGQTDWICKGAMALLRFNVWSNFVQSRLVPAQYYRDPQTENDYNNYLESSNFLADINNERELKNEKYKANIGKLTNFVMWMFEDDRLVVPKESSWFEEVNGTETIPLRARKLYQEDWLGLRELDRNGGLRFRSAPGDHLENMGELINKTIVEYFGPWKRTFESDMENPAGHGYFEAEELQNSAEMLEDCLTTVNTDTHCDVTTTVHKSCHGPNLFNPDEEKSYNPPAYPPTPGPYYPPPPVRYSPDTQFPPLEPPYKHDTKTLETRDLGLEISLTLPSGEYGCHIPILGPQNPDECDCGCTEEGVEECDIFGDLPDCNETESNETISNVEKSETNSDETKIDYKKSESHDDLEADKIEVGTHSGESESGNDEAETDAEESKAQEDGKKTHDDQSDEEPQTPKDEQKTDIKESGNESSDNETKGDEEPQSTTAETETDSDNEESDNNKEPVTDNRKEADDNTEAKDNTGTKDDTEAKDNKEPVTGDKKETDDNTETDDKKETDSNRETETDAEEPQTQDNNKEADEDDKSQTPADEHKVDDEGSGTKYSDTETQDRESEVRNDESENVDDGEAKKHKDPDHNSKSDDAEAVPHADPWAFFDDQDQDSFEFREICKCKHGYCYCEKAPLAARNILSRNADDEAHDVMIVCEYNGPFINWCKILEGKSREVRDTESQTTDNSEDIRKNVCRCLVMEGVRYCKCDHPLVSYNGADKIRLIEMDNED